MYTVYCGQLLLLLAAAVACSCLLCVRHSSQKSLHETLHNTVVCGAPFHGKNISRICEPTQKMFI